MPILRIPAPLRAYTAGQHEVNLPGATAGELMANLVGRFPALQPHLYNNQGELRPFVNLFTNNVNIKDLQGLETPLQAEDRLLLVPSIAGG